MIYRSSRECGRVIGLGRSVAIAMVVCAALSGRALGQESWSFISLPDFMNADIGTLVGYPGYPDGWKDSTTAGFESTLSYYLDAIAGENPDMVLVAGDLVEGEWHHDTTGRNIFGTYNTHANRQAALHNAADLYYAQWMDRFTSRGLTPYPAVGDHELGDNNWNVNSSRAKLVPDFKAAFARHFTQDGTGQTLYGGTINGVPARPVGTPYEDTAYAVQNKNVLMVTIDAFRQDDPGVKLDNRTGSVLGTVDGGQLTWLDNLLAAANADPTIDHIVVQAHTPVLTPVRVRGSSELYLRDYDNTTSAANADKGAATDFWQTLAAHGVDLFLAGEVHHNTLSISNGVTQIVTDGIPFSAGHYLKATVTGERIDFELKYVDIGPGTEKFWQTVSNNKTETVVQGSAWETVATATYDKSSDEKKLINATGHLAPFGTNDGSITQQTLLKTGEHVEVGAAGIGTLPLNVFIDNHDFEFTTASYTPPGIADNTVHGWHEELANKSNIDDEATGNAPADFTKTGRLHNTNNAAINQDLGAYWVEGETYTLSFNAWEAGWRIGATNDSFIVELRQQDGTVLWDSGIIDVDDTLAGSYGSITYGPTNDSYTFLIDTDTFTTGTPGSLLNLRFRRWDGVTWYDDITLVSDTLKHDAAVLEVPDELKVEPGVTLGVDLLSPTVHDRVAVTNEALLAGGGLVINQQAAPALGDTFVVMTAGGITGTFDQTAMTGTDLADTDTALAVLYEDTNADTVVDRVRLLATYRGDANGDGTVSLVDLNALGAGFGTGSTWQAGDFNYDGVVSLADLNALGTNFGRSVPTSPAVPEPASLLLLGFGALALSRGRRAAQSLR